MLRVVPSPSTPARRPALFFAVLLAVLLQGCSLLPWHKEAAQDDTGSALTTQGGTGAKDSARSGFTVTVEGPDEVRELLDRHLELQRYRQLDDIGVTELSRLMVAAEANARELLGTLGYFTPHLVLQLRDTPGAA
jgi:translocation and assembly module TamA